MFMGWGEQGLNREGGYMGWECLDLGVWAKLGNKSDEAMKR
jgi:hypothetical protein